MAWLLWVIPIAVFIRIVCLKQHEQTVKMREEENARRAARQEEERRVAAGNIWTRATAWTALSAIRAATSAHTPA